MHVDLHLKKFFELKEIDIDGNQPASDDKSKQKVDCHYIHLIRE